MLATAQASSRSPALSGGVESLLHATAADMWLSHHRLQELEVGHQVMHGSSHGLHSMYRNTCKVVLL